MTCIDVLVVVPFQPASALVSLDPKYRQTVGASMSLPLSMATLELEAYIGRSLDFWDSNERPVFNGQAMPFPDHRSLTAVALATCLERAGISWRALDPGTADLDYWHGILKKARNHNPRAVALSTTFITNAPWLRALCAIIRKIFPDTKLVVGGYYYATNVREFLNLDADILCVGEGEVRLPLIIRKIASNESVDAIPGLYIRDAHGIARHTGHVEPLELAKIAPPDWSLASRIEPYLDPDQSEIEYGVETQRGCIFKCEFCNYRTLASPESLNAADAADAILAAGRYKRGFINIADSTASYPHARWEELLERLIQKGGSPHPIWAFTRVTDLNPLRAKLMAKAGVREVFIGQESGDQSILNLMKKGTKASQIKPAMAALREAGIGATVSFMHGFPGENAQTIQTTRQLITELNEPDWRNPTAFTYIIYPFAFLDFAAVSQQSQFASVNHYLGYDDAPISGKRAAEESLATIIAGSQKPYAPVYALLTEAGPPTSGLPTFVSRHREQIFRWLKAVERGMAIFLERDLEGYSSGEQELRGIREDILSKFPSRSWTKRSLHSVRAKMTKSFVKQLRREWQQEAHGGSGLLTKAAVSYSLALKTRSRKIVFSSWKTASVPIEASNLDATPAKHDGLAKDLIQRALAPRPRKRANSLF